MIPGSANPLLLKSAADAAGGLQISRSIRLNSADSAYFSRTPAVAGNRRTWKWSGWVKRSALGVNAALFGRQQSDDTNTLDIRFGPGDTLRLANFNSYLLETTQVFRDTSAWFHLVLALDTTQATANNRARMYVNGVEVTQFGARTNPTQNADLAINSTTLHHLGATVSGGGATYYFPGYLTNIHFIDGQALDPSSFTETDATTGQLIPKTYTGSYGTNGFNLLFADNSAATATTLGKDSAGSNNWTPNNLSVTAGAGNDSLVDSPTNYGTDTGVGGTVRGNYCTNNPLDSLTQTLSNGNLDIASGASYGTTRGTIGVSSGKWYWEYTMNSLVSNTRGNVGIAKAAATLTSYVGSDAYSWGYHSGDGNKYDNGNTTSYGNSYTSSDVIGVAFDADNGKLFFSKNGTWQASGDPVAGTNAAFTGLTSGPYFPATSFITGTGGASSISCNHGQRAFAYTAPSGFKALCTQNLPAPLVTKSNTVFDTVLYTGTGSTRTISGLGFSPDFVWLKVRNTTGGHPVFDTIRGATNYLQTQSTGAEGTDTDALTAFTSDGFTLGSGGTIVNANINSNTYVAWAWDAGTSTVSNTQGSITGGAQVRANPSAGFSVATWTGDGISTATVGHGLGVSPSLIITKSRSNSSNWGVYHSSIGSTQYLLLNSTSAAQTSSSPWNNTAPTSTVYSIGDASFSNVSGYTYVGYAFAPVVGYSSFGSYTGNGSSDGPFVFLGFRPGWVMIKRTDLADTSFAWRIMDTKRSTANTGTTAPLLAASATDAEGAANAPDLLSNGFKWRVTDGNVNANGGTYIYAAFAEAPFNYSRAR